MDRKTLLTTLLIGGGTDAGTAIAQLQHAVSVLDETKADKTGTVALADNLTPYSADSGVTQSIPFNSQGTGCGNGESVVDTGSYAQIKKKLGNTICYNQLVDSDTTEVTIPSGRKYWARINGTDVGGTSDGTAVAVTGGTDKFCDLSLWYGSNGSIPAHLLSHPEDFGRYYSGSLAYNPGQLVNADGSVLTSIGRNVWDEEWEYGGISATTGEDSGTATSEWRTKNYIRCIPDTYYYFAAATSNKNIKPRFYDAQKNYIGYQDKNGENCRTNTAFCPPVNAHYMRFAPGVADVPTPNHDITISLYYPGESGYDQYYRYIVLAEVDTGSEVIVGRNGRGDYKTPDGVVHRVMSDVNLGSLTYTKYTSGNNWIFYASIPDGRTGVGGGEILLISDVYTCSPTSKSGSQAIAGTDKNISWDSTNSQVLIKDLSISTVEALVSALNGKTLYYEKATPTTEQGTPFSGASADNFAIDDFGSMYWTQTNGVPQGVEIFYPYDYKAAVDTLLNMVEGDVEELVTETELGAVADRIPEAPAEDGTYTLKATVADGVKTYAWVADA